MSQERTEEPTPKRLEKARKEGDSGGSALLSQAVAFVVGVMLLPAFGVSLWRWGTHALALAIQSKDKPSLDGVLAHLGSLVALIAPLGLAVAAASVLTSLLMTGGNISSHALRPKLDFLDVVRGLRSLVSAPRLFHVGRSLFLAACIGILAYDLVRRTLSEFVSLRDATGMAHVVGDRASRLLRTTALLGLGMGLVDGLVHRWSWKRRLKMSRTEVRRELKESEGDPEIKAARERAHREMLAAVAIGNVKNATVVVVNPTHLACALRYSIEERDGAPVVLASGQGDLAQQIVRAARDFGVPVVEAQPLARALVELELGEEIPEALYEAVATVLHELRANTEDP